MLENCKITGFADEIHSDFQIQLEVLEELGQKFIELRGADGINVADLTIEKAQELKERMQKQGVKVSALGSPIGKIGITDEFEPHFEKFKHVVELAKLFETPYIRMFSFYMPKNENSAIYRAEVLNRLQKMVDYATEQDVVLLHENEKGIYGEDALTCKDLMDNLYGEHFKCIFDFANFVQCKQDTLEAYEMLKPYITYLHIKDAMWENGEVVPAGKGDGQVAKILGMLASEGFEGYLSLEPHLSDFAGLKQLERAEDTQSGFEKKMERGKGALAYRLAYESLMEICR